MIIFISTNKIIVKFIFIEASFPLLQINPPTCCASCAGTCARIFLKWKRSATCCGTSDGDKSVPSNYGVKHVPQLVPRTMETNCNLSQVHAIRTCIQKNIDSGYHRKYIYILSDSQSAIKALNSTQIKSRLVTLMWVPGHRGIASNGKADQLARQSSETPFTRPKPVLGISKNRCSTLIEEWIKQTHQQHWEQSDGQTHSKVMVGHPSRTLTADFLNLNRTKARIIVGLLTGHCG